MPKSALPPHLQDFDWQGTDNASWLMRQKKKLQYLITAGPRVPSGFFKWRDIPKCLFAKRGEGYYRLENTDGTEFRYFGTPNYYPKVFYLSRVQPWCRWHVSLQWPLFFNFHVMYSHKSVVEPLKYQSSFGITKMLTFGIGFKRDGDKVYWLTANLGGNFE